MEGVQEVRIKKIGVFSIGNTFGIIYLIIGFIAGIIILISSLSPPSSNPDDFLSNFEEFLWVLRIGSVTIFPIIMYILGFISGVITAFLYNLSAKITKGIKLYS